MFRRTSLYKKGNNRYGTKKTGRPLSVGTGRPVIVLGNICPQKVKPICNAEMGTIGRPTNNDSVSPSWRIYRSIPIQV